MKDLSKPVSDWSKTFENKHWAESGHFSWGRRGRTGLCLLDAACNRVPGWFLPDWTAAKTCTFNGQRFVFLSDLNLLSPPLSLTHIYLSLDTAAALDSPSPLDCLPHLSAEQHTYASRLLTVAPFLQINFNPVMRPTTCCCLDRVCISLLPMHC